MTPAVPAQVAYLVNVYPAPSHSFIRREIAAVEALGVRVHRFSLRRGTAPLVDAADRAEAGRTQVLLASPLAAGAGLLAGVLRQFLARPRRSAAASAFALRLAASGDRRFIAHLGHFALACALLPRLRRTGAAHLHVHFGSNAADVALLCRCLGGPPYSLTVHGPEEWTARVNLREKIAGATFVVGISGFTLGKLREAAAPADRHKLHLLRCGLDAGLIDADVAGPPPDVARFVCVGRLCERKAQELLIAAVAQLAARGIAVELVLAGDGERRGAIEAQLRRLGLASQVRLAGWLSEAQVRREILASRALVLASLDEGLPVVLTEAMALCRPVIATRVGGTAELVQGGVNGWLVAPGSAPALAAAMAECLATPVSRLQAMGIQGRAQVASRHVAAVQAGRLATLFGCSSDERTNVHLSDILQIDLSVD